MEQEKRFFRTVCALLPRPIMGLYTRDDATKSAAAAYLAILSGSFLPMAGATLLVAFVWKLSIPWVYFLLSLEECVRFAISLGVLRKRIWMRS